MRIWKAKEVKLKTALNTKKCTEKLCQVQFEPIFRFSQLLILLCDQCCIFLWIRNFFDSCVRKKWTKKIFDPKNESENREHHNSCEKKWLRKKNRLEIIVKNCLYMLQYEKLKIIYQVHVEIFDCCCVKMLF